MAKGWHKERKRHSLARKGIKTTKVTPRIKARLRANPSLMNKSFKQLQKEGVFLKFKQDADGDGVINVKDCKPLDPKKQDLKGAFKKFKEFTKEKAVPFVKKEAKVVTEFTKKKIEEEKERRKRKREAELADVKHPIALKIQKQEKLVSELRKQNETEDDADEKERIDAQLDKQEFLLTTLQEDLTEVQLADLSDKQLKTLAVRTEGGLFGGNQYEGELLRRARKKTDIKIKEKEIANEEKIKLEELNKRLAEERKRAREDTGFF